jgi:small-conductance mechanosensitive channel
MALQPNLDLEVQQYWLSWERKALYWLRDDAPHIVGAIIVACLLAWLFSFLKKRLLAISEREAATSLRRSQQLRTMAAVLNGVGSAVIIFIAAVTILKTLGIDIAPILASAGIVGLAVGFGAQTLVKDVINGFFILMENQYNVGDVIRVAGVQGKVETMTLRRTVLRDDNGSIHTVPNSEIHIVSNLTHDWSQVALRVTTAYSEPSDRVIALLEEVAAAVRSDPAFSEAILSDPQVPGIERVEAGEVDYLLLVRTRAGEQYRVSRELRRRIKESFEKNGIAPAAPARMFVSEARSGASPK